MKKAARVRVVGMCLVVLFASATGWSAAKKKTVDGGGGWIG